MSQTPPTNDPVYKRLYTFREMVADLLRSLFPADLIAADPRIEKVLRFNQVDHKRAPR